MKICHKCNEAWTRREQPGFKRTCSGCEGYLHCCRNCKLYNPTADRCSSITAECTGDRAGVNYCEEFQFRDVPNNANHRNGRGAATARREGRALGFNGAPTEKEPTGENTIRGRKKFDKLFEN